MSKKFNTRFDQKAVMVRFLDSSFSFMPTERFFSNICSIIALTEFFTVEALQSRKIPVLENFCDVYGMKIFPHKTITTHSVTSLARHAGLILRWSLKSYSSAAFTNHELNIFSVLSRIPTYMISRPSTSILVALPFLFGR